ncbi:MAG: hypothetical protein IJW40_03375 [Clostridia bacterium]|nr:hypothetical protein [Clostridia bacterium]
MQEVTAFPIAPVDGTFSYAVMRREDSSSAERDALIAIRNALKDVYGASPKPETEYDTEELTDEQIAARFEILVGQTGRPESDEVYASLGDNEYTVCVKGHKLVVLGKNDTLTAFAVKAFERMIKQAPQNIVGDYAYLKSYIPGAYDGSYDFEDLGYEKVTDVRFEVRNGENNADIFYITSDNYHYTYGYYSNNSWVDGDILIAARSARDDAVNFGPAELVALDIYNEEAWLLPITAKGYSEYVVDSELIYYLTGNDLRCFNLLTGTEHTVITMSSMSFPHITANGSHINVSRHVNGLDTGTVINTQTGETYDIMAVRFEEPYPIANHHMICPTDPTVMFFSHEGTTTDIPDRLWIAKLGEEPYNIAYQTVDANGKPLDCFGHEYWAPDGEGLYFVKYSVSPSFPKGVCYVSLDDIENPEVLYSKYPYWHVSCSPDGRYVTSDTQSGSYSGVCLIDTETDEEIMVYKAQTYRQTHPGHPHPCFNTTSTALCFNDHNLDNGRVSIGVYIISE